MSEQKNHDEEDGEYTAVEEGESVGLDLGDQKTAYIKRSDPDDEVETRGAGESK